MFACFGKKNKKKEKKKKSSSKKEHPEEDEDNPSSINVNKNSISNLNSDEEREHLEEELTKLKIDKENLSFSNENNQRLLNFIDSLIRDFKTNFSIHFDDDEDDNDNDDKSVSIMKYIKKEKSTLETKLELLSSDYSVLQSQYKASYDEFERLTDPVSSQKEKLEQRKFVLLNLLQQKNNFLRFLEMKQSSIKKSKKNRNSIIVDDIFLNNNQGTYQGLLNKIHASEIAQQNESSLNNESFDKESEYGGFKDSDAHKETIRKLISENVEYSRMTYQKVYKQTIEENEKYVKNIKMLSMLKNGNDNKEEDASKGGNCKENVNNKKKEEKKKEDEKELKMKQEELMKKQNTINELLVEIEKVKTANTSLEKEIGDMYEELSMKFKTAIKLEKQLEKIKAAKKKLMTTKNINNK